MAFNTDAGNSSPGLHDCKAFTIAYPLSHLPGSWNIYFFFHLSLFITVIILHTRKINKITCHSSQSRRFNPTLLKQLFYITHMKFPQIPHFILQEKYIFLSCRQIRGTNEMKII